MSHIFKQYLLTIVRAFVAAFVVSGMVISVSVAGENNTNAAQGDIVDIAGSTGSFTTLLAAVEAAGLVDALKADGPYTVFAPTDEAFANFAEWWPGTLENLLEPENKERLVALLTYHVVPGKIMSSEISGTMMPTTLQGSAVTIVANEGVTIDYANVVNADVETSNGVIHVIDAVIIPKEQMSQN